MIKCCKRAQNTIIYETKTLLANKYSMPWHEELEILHECEHCKKITIVYTKTSLTTGEKIQEILAGKRAKKFLRNEILKMIEKGESYNSQRREYYKQKFGLRYYNEHVDPQKQSQRFLKTDRIDEVVNCPVEVSYMENIA